jgi:hypothetical protein
MIREEIWRWVSLADQSSGSKSVAAGLKSVMTKQQKETQRYQIESEQPQPDRRQQERQQDTRRQDTRHRSKSPKRLNASHATSRDTRDAIKPLDRAPTSLQRDHSALATASSSSRRQDIRQDNDMPIDAGRRLHEARGTPQRPRRVQPQSVVDNDTRSHRSKRIVMCNIMALTFPSH